MRERNYRIRLACCMSGIVFLIFFSGLYMNCEAGEVGTGEREAAVSFKGTYEDKKEEEKGDEPKKKTEGIEEKTKSQVIQKEGKAASIPKTLPQTGEQGRDAGLGAALAGAILAGYMIKKEDK